MKNMGNIRVALVGLGFGKEFIPIYKALNDTQCVAVCCRNEETVNKIADFHNIEKRYTDYQKLLADPDIDAVHINTPVPDHASMSIAALKAGKHVACTVPMALTLEECDEIIKLEQETGKVYMMMETAIYTREFLYFKALYDSGEMGRIQFMRASHQQNMGLPGWPEYWYGFPPMFYSTHVTGPLATFLGKKITSVRCYGSGEIAGEYSKKYNSPFSVETAHLTFEGSDVVAEITRSLFDIIRQYRESIDVYGSKLSFEWEQTAEENPVLFSGFEDAKRIEVPDTDNLLPKEIAKFTRRDYKRQMLDAEHVTFVQGAGHGGSHPHMVNEFIDAIKENRKSQICAQTAANWTKAGILAHRSALNGGEKINL